MGFHFFCMLVADIKKTVISLELVLICAIPWGAYICLNWFYFERVNGLTIMLGWAFLFVHQLIGAALLLQEQAKKKEKNIVQWLLALIFLILALRQALTKGSFTEFLLEKTALDALSTVTAVTLALFVFKNRQGKTAWQDIGLLPLVFGAVIVGGSYLFVEVYIEILYAKNSSWFSYFQISAVFLMTVFAHLTALRSVIKNKVELKDVFEGKYGMVLILGQLFFWISMPGWVYLLKLFQQ